MTLPITGLPELTASQSQPHVPVNAALRGLEVFAGVVIAKTKDLATPPGSPADGDVYLLPSDPTGDWSGHAFELAYYSGGWQFIALRAGVLAYMVDEGLRYTFAPGSPSGWALFTAETSGANLSASDIPFNEGGSPTGSISDALVALQASVSGASSGLDAASISFNAGGSPTPSVSNALLSNQSAIAANSVTIAELVAFLTGIDATRIPYAGGIGSPSPGQVGAALDQLVTAIVAAQASIASNSASITSNSVTIAELVAFLTGINATGIPYAGGIGSPGPNQVGAALDQLFTYAATIPLTVGIPWAVPGKPTAGAVYNISIPFACSLPAGLTGSVGKAGTPAASSAAFTLYKNGTSFGTVTFGSGSPGDAAAFAAASPASFVAGDVLAIVAPVTQDNTLSDAGFTLLATRV